MQQVEGQTAQDRHVVGGVAGTNAAFILPEGHVQEPSADGSQYPSGCAWPAARPRIRRQAGDVVAGFRDNLFTLSPLGLDHHQTVQVGPDPVGIHVPGVFRCPPVPSSGTSQCGRGSCSRSCGSRGRNPRNPPPARRRRSRPRPRATATGCSGATAHSQWETASLLAVHRYDLNPKGRGQRLYPACETAFQRLGVQPREDTSKGIVRGNPVRQFQKRGQPSLLLASEQLNLGSAVGTTVDGQVAIRRMFSRPCSRTWGQRGSSTSVNRTTGGTEAGSAMGEPPAWDAASHPTQSRHHPIQ